MKLTYRENILDHCYTTIWDAYHSVPRAALGLSDHCLVHLLPTYRQKLKSAKPVARTAKRWSSETERALQACFDCTDWSVFEAAATDLDELTDTVTSYISFCEDMCIPTRTRLTYNNDKPWFTMKLRQLRQAKEDAYRSGDKVLYNQAKNTLTKEIRAAKRSYSEKLKNQFSANDPASVWKGLKDITNYKPSSPQSMGNQRLADDLNDFYCPNRSVDDAVNMGLHYILQHLDRPGTYVRILFVDFSSAFNTIIPDLLLPKLTQLSVPTSTCQWIINFLSNRQQLVSTGAPQGCVLSPLLYSLYTNECTSTDPSVKLLKFADDTTVIGLIQDGDESAYRKEVAQLAAWCSQNNLELNAFKTVEMIVDFRRNPPSLPPLTILDSTVDTVESFRFLGSTISQDLKWESHIDSIVKKAQQRLYFLRQLRKFNLPQELLTQFYSVVIESVLCTSITVWYGSATKSDLRRLQRTVRSAEKIIGAPLPTLQDLYDSRVKNRARKIIIDSTHPAHKLFDLLPSGRRFRAPNTRTSRHRSSFFPQAISLLNR
ncbi:hypothetical protein IRJ41_010952 [Triplophysa rosa]|uniref:Reverse transcriptase domain-containing protein n=1 Tax=Triplophysa rosa TaxID=992332 RepID=A0A9W8CBN5_TRIRA|nr:hypothetical protein IRJ41_010952 [Triplophysa rosa]